NGGHRLRPWRRTRAGNVRMRSGQEQRGHPAPVAADQVLVVEDAEGVDQRAPGQAVVEAAVAPQHLQELLEPGLGIAGYDLVHAEQVAGAQVARVGVEIGRASCRDMW